MTVESKELIIDARGGHDGSATGGNYGPYTIVYASREGLAEVETVEDYRKSSGSRLRYHNRKYVVKISWNLESFNPSDYIVARHRYSENPYIKGSSKRESYELIAGEMPSWASFPELWRKYVYDCTDCAARALYDFACHLNDEELISDANYALRKSSKGNISSGWTIYQNTCERKGLLKYVPEHKYTWTGVRAMPIKIAKAIKRELWKGSNIDISFLDKAPHADSIKPQGVIIAEP